MAADLWISVFSTLLPVAHGTLSVGRPSGPKALGTEDRGDGSSRGVVVPARGMSLTL